MDTRYFLLFCSILLSAPVMTQTLVSGKVLDASTQEPMSGVSIFTRSTNEGGVSNQEGNFSFVSNDSLLIISFIGYKSIERKIDLSLKAVTLNVVMSFYPESLLGVSVSATSETYQLPPAIVYLPKRDLKINSEISIVPTLNLVPGVLMHSGALNTNRITIRGIGNRNLFGTAKIRAYLDGIPITNGSGETTIEDIDLSIIESVKVHKGPASSIYGAGLGGMISLQVPNDLNQSGTSFSIQNLTGSYGLLRNTANFAHGNVDRSLLSLNFNQTHSDGYRNNNEYDRKGINGFGKIKINEKEEFKFFGSYNTLDAFIPGALDSMTYVDNPEAAAFIWGRSKGKEETKKLVAGAAYEAHIGKHFSQISSVFVAHRQSNEIRPFNILHESSLSTGIRTEWIYDHSFFENYISDFQFHIGGEVFNEDYNWQTYTTDGEGSRDDIISDNYEQRNSFNIFSQVNFDLNYNLSLTAGINSNYTVYDFSDYFHQDGDQSSSNAFPVSWSPFFNMGLDLAKLLSWKEKVVLSGTVSHGFSPPTVEESLLPDGRINPDLRPEQGWNYELGVKGNFQNKLFYNASVYTMQIKDLLVAERSDFDQFIGVNAGKTSHNGVELSLKYIQNFGSLVLEPILNYTYSDYTFTTFINNDNDFSGNDLTGSAPHLLTLGTHWKTSNLYGNIIYRFVDAMPVSDDNSIYSEAYQMVDLKIGYRNILLKKWGIDLFGGINNLLNEKYASMISVNAGSFGNAAPRYFYPGLPRNFYAGIKVSFGE